MHMYMYNSSSIHEAYNTNVTRWYGYNPNSELLWSQIKQCNPNFNNDRLQKLIFLMLQQFWSTTLYIEYTITLVINHVKMMMANLHVGWHKQLVHMSV